MKVDYNEIQEYMNWMKKKLDLKFNTSVKEFPVMYNCIYWAYMGCNVGSEEGKHRPILIIRTYKNSPVCAVLPLTTQRLNDEYWYHVDLEYLNSTVLCEQMRIIDIARIEKPYRIKGRIATISRKDWEGIDKEIKWLYSMKDKPNE